MLSKKYKNCTFYSAYYKQFSSSYVKLINGYCAKRQKPQKQTEICEEFVINEQKELSREKRRLKNLDFALEAIKDIAHILKENKLKNKFGIGN